MDINDILLYALVFAIVLLPSVFLQAWLGRSKEPVKKANPTNLPAILKLGYPAAMLLCGLGIGSLMCSLFPHKKEQYAKKLMIGNINSTPEMIFSSQIFFCLVIAAFGVVWFMLLPLDRNWLILALPIGGFIGWITPSTVVESAADKRQAEIIKGLPFAIDLIGSAMRSGLDFGAAIRYYVSLGIPGPLSMEFGIMLRQIELGKTRVEALNSMAERICSNEFTSFVGAVAYGTEVGASIADTMSIQGEELRRARFNLAERKAARAPSLMILPMAIFILPAVFIIIFMPVYLKIQASGMGAFFN